MTSRGDVRPKWVLGVGACLVIPALFGCKLLDRLKGGETPAPDTSTAPPATSIAPEFEAPPAVTVSAAVADASVPPLDASVKDLKDDDKKDPKVDDKKDGKKDADPKKDAGTTDPKDPKKDAGTTDPKKDAGTTDPKDPKKDAGTTDPKKDAGLDPKLPTKECVAKCNTSLQKCIKKLDANGLPNLEKCRAAFVKCEKACK